MHRESSKGGAQMKDRRIARRMLRLPSPTTVIAAIALIVATAGVATAGRSSADSKPQATAAATPFITGNHVLDNSLTGADINEGTLGQVPSAAAAGHAAPTGGAGGALTGSYPSPSLAGGAVTPSKFGVIPAARLNRPSNQTFSTGSVTPVGFNSEIYDNSGMHDNVTNNSRLRAPIAGIYAVSAGFDWSSGGGERYADILKNGTTAITQLWQNATSSGLTEMNLSSDVNLAAGDFVELRV